MINKKLKAKMVEEDNFIWRILSVIGIRISRYCMKSYEKYLSQIIVIISFVFIIHWISITLNQFLISSTTNMELLYSSSCPLNSFLFGVLWIFEKKASVLSDNKCIITETATDEIIVSHISWDSLYLLYFHYLEYCPWCLQS